MTRRGHNEGSIYKRSDVNWTGVISVNGKRKFIYGKTRQQAHGKENVYRAFCGFSPEQDCHKIA